MSRSSTVRETVDGTGMYETMLKYSTEPRWYVMGPGLVSPTKVLPDRETQIAGMMGIPCYGPMVRVEGKYIKPEPTYWTRAQCEQAIDARGPLWCDAESNGTNNVG